VGHIEVPQELAEGIRMEEFILRQGDLDPRQVAERPGFVHQFLEMRQVPAWGEEAGVEDDQGEAHPEEVRPRPPLGEVEVVARLARITAKRVQVVEDCYPHRVLA
jgi:hypothetical protein